MTPRALVLCSLPLVFSLGCPASPTPPKQPVAGGGPPATPGQGAGAASSSGARPGPSPSVVSGRILWATPLRGRLRGRVEASLAPDGHAALCWTQDLLRDPVVLGEGAGALATPVTHGDNGRIVACLARLHPSGAPANLVAESGRLSISASAVGASGEQWVLAKPDGSGPDSAYWAPLAQGTPHEVALAHEREARVVYVLRYGRQSELRSVWVVEGVTFAGFLAPTQEGGVRFVATVRGKADLARLGVAPLDPRSSQSLVLVRLGPQGERVSARVLGEPLAFEAFDEAPDGAIAWGAKLRADATLPAAIPGGGEPSRIPATRYPAGLVVVHAPEGGVRWARVFGEGEIDVTGVLALPDGGAIVSGAFRGKRVTLADGVELVPDVPRGQVDRGGFVARCAPDGTPLWARHWGGPPATRLLRLPGERILVDVPLMHGPRTIGPGALATIPREEGGWGLAAFGLDGALAWSEQILEHPDGASSPASLEVGADGTLLLATLFAWKATLLPGDPNPLRLESARGQPGGYLLARIQLPDSKRAGPPPARLADLVPPPKKEGAPTASGPPSPLPAGLSPGKVEGEFVNATDGSILVWVPPGRYRVGHDTVRLSYGCAPSFEADLTRGVFLGKFEVTWGQFRRFCAETKQPLPSPRRRDAHVPDDATDAHPVYGVTFAQAEAYCGWAGLRLPSEAEWEAAARGPKGHPYPWGEEAPDPRRANLQGLGDRYEHAATVGSFPAGAAPCGALDLIGNVAEWTQDRWAGSHGSFFASPRPDPQGPGLGTQRVVKGGSFASEPARVHGAGRWPGYTRAAFEADQRRRGIRRDPADFRGDSQVGLRVARSPR